MEYWSCLRTWGSVIGLGFDVVGAVLVYYGIRISIAKANALEEVAIPVLMDDLGSPENIEENRQLSQDRAMERIRASRWAAAGLACFILGFLLQAVGSWPRG
jgi:hypothetical protein